jgi:hypothetical protein
MCKSVSNGRLSKAYKADDDHAREVPYKCDCVLESGDGTSCK